MCSCDLHAFWSALRRFPDGVASLRVPQGWRFLLGRSALTPKTYQKPTKNLGGGAKTRKVIDNGPKRAQALHNKFWRPLHNNQTHQAHCHIVE